MVNAGCQVISTAGKKQWTDTAMHSKNTWGPRTSMSVGRGTISCVGCSHASNFSRAPIIARKQWDNAFWRNEWCKQKRWLTTCPHSRNGNGPAHEIDRILPIKNAVLAMATSPHICLWARYSLYMMARWWWQSIWRTPTPTQTAFSEIWLSSC